MALSKSTRIIILLAIDSAFFLLELIVGMSCTTPPLLDFTHCSLGYGVHSLALVADSFHMASFPFAPLNKTMG